MSIGREDYCLELGVEPSMDGMEIFYPVSWMVTVCKSAGIIPIDSSEGLEVFETYKPSNGRHFVLVSLGAKVRLASIRTRWRCLTKYSLLRRKK